MAADLSFLGYSTLATAADKGPKSTLLKELNSGKPSPAQVSISPRHCSGLAPSAAATARYRLPAVYPYKYFATSGGLISYGPDSIDPLRRAAGYVARILRGAKPADLPVQQADQV